MSIKPGYKTSEFWFTVVSFIFSGLYLTGLIKENDHKEELITIVSHAVESCILISGQVVILYKYVNGRTKIKQQFEQKEIKNERNKNSVTTTESRSNKNGSRQLNTKRKKQSSRSKKTSNKWSLENFTISNR